MYSRRCGAISPHTTRRGNRGGERGVVNMNYNVENGRKLGYLKNDLVEFTEIVLKVIPSFRTAHSLLHITLLLPRWRRFFPLARKEQTKAAFAELKLLFAIILPQIG